MDFTNRVVLITGASSGIGAACALKFATLHAKLSLIGRNEANLNRVAEQCRQLSGLTPLTIKADVKNDDDNARMVKQTVEHYGRLDILLNNAGVVSLSGLQGGISEFDHIIATNLRGPYLLTSLALPHLTKTKGNIVNMSSVLSMKPHADMMAYCMSKAALDMMTKCLAVEFGPSGVRVNSVNPGPVRTEIFKRAGISEEDNQNFFGILETKTPLRKVSEGEEVADLVAFIASDKAGSITGANYLIDCGVALGENSKS